MDWSMSKKLPNDFDPDLYLELNPDVKAAGVDPRQHYLEWGIKEKRAYKTINSSLSEETAYYSSDKPSNTNSFNLFKGSWSTYFEDSEKINY